MKLFWTVFVVLFVIVCHLKLQSFGAVEIQTCAKKETNTSEKGKSIKKRNIIFSHWLVISQSTLHGYSVSMKSTLVCIQLLFFLQTEMLFWTWRRRSTISVQVRTLSSILHSFAHYICVFDIFSVNCAGFTYQRDNILEDESNKTLRMNAPQNRSKRNFIALKRYWWNSQAIPYMLDKSLGEF